MRLKYITYDIHVYKENSIRMYYMGEGWSMMRLHQTSGRESLRNHVFLFKHRGVVRVDREVCDVSGDLYFQKVFGVQVIGRRSATTFKIVKSTGK